MEKAEERIDSKMTILIVDDEERICENLENSVPWKDIGIDEVKTANDAETALRIFREASIDIVVTDIMMNGMNGLELIKEIRKENASVPMIILSAYDLFSYAKEAVHLNVNRYILKPIMLTEITQTLDEVVKELKIRKKQDEFEGKIRRQIQNSLSMLRERFLYEVLTMSTRPESDLRDNLDFYRIDDKLLEGGLVMSLQAFPPNNGKAGTERDWQIYKFAVKNIVQEVLAVWQPSYDLPFIDDRLPVIFAGSDREELNAAVYRAASEITTHIYRYLEVEMNVGIGRWYAKPGDLQKSYKESMEVLRFSEFEGYKRVDHIDEVDAASLSSWHELSPDQMHDIMQTIHRMDWEKALEQWLEIENAVLHEESGVPFDFVKTYCIGLISSIAMHNLEDGSTDRLMEHLYQLNNRKNKSEILSIVKNLLSRQAERHMNRKNQSPYLEQIKKYVEEHYHEDISFSQLARDLHLSRTYLSYLFKRETGETFVNFLIKYRIDVAKKLMSSSRHLMVREIASMVGYQDPAYFSRLFKNVTGMSPSEYQMRV